MPEKDYIIQNQLDRIAELEQDNASQLTRLAHLEETNQNLRQQYATLRGQFNEVCDRLYETVAAQGKENDYCRDGMADFCASVLDITYEEAYGELGKYFAKHIEIRITATVTDPSEDHMTSFEAESFVQGVLGTEEVEIDHFSLSFDDE